MSDCAPFWPVICFEFGVIVFWAGAAWIFIDILRRLRRLEEKNGIPHRLP